MSQEQLPLGLPPRCGEWIGAVITLPRYVSGDGPPYRPSALIWLEPTSGLIVGMEVLRQNEALARAAELFRRASDSPMAGEPRTPRRLRVASPELAQALRDGVGDVELVIAPTPEIDKMASTLVERLAASDREDDSELTYIGPDMAASDVARFFRASAALYRATPWDAVPPDGFLSVTCSQLGIEAGALCVVGQAGEAFGFALFRSNADALTYLDACEEQMAGEDGSFPPHLMLSYDDRPTIGEVLAEEIARHGWEIEGPEAYPSVVMLDGDRISRGLTRDELEGVTAIADAVARFAAEGLGTAWDGAEPITWKSSSGDVVLGAPLWLLDEDDSDAVRRRCFAVLERFAETDNAADHLGWLELLITYSVDYMGAGLGDVSPMDLDELLFEIVPRKVSCEPTDAPAIIAATRAFLTFAADELDSTAARQSLASLRPDTSQLLARRLADPRNFGMAKSLVMAATRAGYDRSEGGLAAYMRATNGRPSLGAAPERSRESRKQADAAKRAKRKSQRKARKNSRRR
jgi:hypothetical protein